ncbi:MAG: 16S rRNA (adenine(1518)-N(6)/adenine(1519)-N(6))-dimethyltransferase RsmA [Candidatus Saccharimonadales bacterium]
MQKLPETNKSLGQHWLTDASALGDIVDAAQLSPVDTVVEIGPGPGTLTRLLVKQASQVIAVEFDAKLARELPGRVTANNLRIVTQDILSFDFTAVPAPYKVVANIPYYLTSNLIRVLSESSNPPTTAVILIQKEVAQRVTAAPGAMSLLSVTAQYYWETSLGALVPAELFTPPPKVDSQVLILQHRSKPQFEDVDTKLFFQLVKAGFGQRRKTLLNSLSSGLRLDKTVITSVCELANIDPKRRAQTLDLTEWNNLYQILQTANT